MSGVATDAKTEEPMLKAEENAIVTELRNALKKADAALRNHACHGGPGVPCLRTPGQCADECGKEAGHALLAVEAALKEPTPHPNRIIDHD